MSKLSKALSDEMTRQLSEFGFRRKKEGIFFLKYGDAMYLRIGLNESAKQGDFLKINLMLGVGYEPLEKLLDELERSKHNPNLFPTFGSNIGGFTAENRVLYYGFARESLCEDVARCVKSIMPIIYSAMRQYPDPQSVPLGLEKLPPIQCRTERSILINYLLGDVEKAKSLAERGLENKKSEHEIMLKRYRDFYEAFNRLV